LLEVVERDRFPAVARRLNLTQPAISLQIREFERRFGVQLIERLGKQAHATVPGRELVEAAKRLPRVRSQDHASFRPLLPGIGAGRLHERQIRNFRPGPFLLRARMESIFGETNRSRFSGLA
jgi:DNA-binding transcriptional LysR family regulator